MARYQVFAVSPTALYYFTMSLIANLARNPFINRTAKRGLNLLPFSIRRIAFDIVANGLISRPPFSGVYKTFADAPNAGYSTAGTPYEFVKAGLKVSREPAADLVILRRQHAMLPMAVGMLSNIGRPIRILDFGGSGGIDFVNVKESCGADIDYHIVELPEICEAGRQIWKDEPRISFTETLPAKTKRFDIVTSWSAVHYVSDPLDLLASFAQYEPQVVLVVASPFSKREFVRSQNNGKKKFPQWVISLPAAVQKMKDVGYKLAFSATDDHVDNVDNYDPEYRVAHSAMLLFVRDN